MTLKIENMPSERQALYHKLLREYRPLIQELFPEAQEIQSTIHTGLDGVETQLGWGVFSITYNPYKETTVASLLVGTTDHWSAAWQFCSWQCDWEKALRKKLLEIRSEWKSKYLKNNLSG